jgi:hypothetical protein
MIARIDGLSVLAALAGLVLTLAPLAPTTARAQDQPTTTPIANPYQRSGLLSRMEPILPPLPPDADRDAFLGSEYASEFDGDRGVIFFPGNSWRNGGMYGKMLSRRHTATHSPFFVGTEGSTIGPDTQREHPVIGRWIMNPLHQFRPIGMYYDRGVSVPIYDFDYTVPGPGPFPWSHFFKRPTGG